MDHDLLITQLANQARSIQNFTGGVSPEQARWKPDPISWSILEVINHLYDEEREDFRRHLDDALYHPEKPWHPIEPQAWVNERRYNERDLQQSVRNFMEERQTSLAWLRKLEDPDWQVDYQAPFGPITAGSLFAGWVAHDLLHLRQLVELHFAYTTLQAQPYVLRYAGEW
jgi:hypothetical protein